MNCETATARLQEQIDGTLDPVVARALEHHLDGCAPCRALASDLGAIADAGAALEPIDAPEHVWLQLAGRWRSEQGLAAPFVAAQGAPAARRASWTFHLLAAAAVLAVAIGGSWIAWRATDPASTVILERAPRADAQGNAGADPVVQEAMDDIRAAEQLYTRAIAGLERAAEEQKDVLEPHVAAALDKNLEVLDEAIGQSRQAVLSQPQSVVARESLFDALRKKVTLLQNTISLVSEISRGNQAGASRLSGT